MEGKRDNVKSSLISSWALLGFLPATLAGRINYHVARVRWMYQYHPYMALPPPSSLSRSSFPSFRLAPPHGFVRHYFVFPIGPLPAAAMYCLF
jgi:hypothetical protein